MGLTGPEGGPPVRVGASVGDLIPALYAVIGIVSALYRRAQSGQGCYLDLAMQDAAVTVVENALARAWATGEDPQPLGSRHPAITPFASFPTSDGEVVAPRATRRCGSACVRPSSARTSSTTPTTPPTRSAPPTCRR